MTCKGLYWLYIAFTASKELSKKPEYQCMWVSDKVKCIVAYSEVHRLWTTLVANKNCVVATTRHKVQRSHKQ